jgi:putative restriction endonuclease
MWLAAPRRRAVIPDRWPACWTPPWVYRTLTNVAEVGLQSIHDARERILASIVRRRGQPEFRQRLLEVYECRCAITACGEEEVLEAAHIVPYFGPASNNVSNGLLLRADIHTLFDLGLISVNPATMQVVVSPRVKDHRYRQLAGLTLRQPKTTSLVPNKSALDQHRKWAGL